MTGKNCNHFALATLAVAVLLTAASAHAAVITWGAATTISADTDVVTEGTLFQATNLGDAAVSPTISGVTFTGDQTVPFESHVTVTGFSARNGTTYGASISTLSANYKNLLSSANYRASSSGVTDTFTINDLTIGAKYLVQFWVDDSRSGSTSAGRSDTIDDGHGHSVVLDFNTTDSTGGLGQFVVGTFTADATSQVINFTGVQSLADAQLNAFQIRLVPEPASLGLFGVSGLLMGCRRRKCA